MNFALRDGVSLCVAGGRIFLLDVFRDRYFCLERESDQALQKILKGWTLDPSDHLALDPHIASGLLTSSDDGRRLSACDAPMAHEDCGHINPARRSLRMLVPMILAIHEAQRDLKRQGLAMTLEIAAQKRVHFAPPIMSVEADQAAVLAASFKWANYLLSARDKCLPRSIAMAAYLNTHNVKASIVFGIMGRPFTAHCWVQVGNRVMNDSIDTVRNYTPIKIV